MIIITGANGFIGSGVVTEVLKHFPNEEILPVDTVSSTTHNLLTGKKTLPLTSPQAMWETIDSNKAIITCFIHLGACSSTTEADWDYLVENNIEFSKKIFSWCTENKLPLLYASSASVYGDGEHGFIESLDTEILVPLNLYGKSKCDFDTWVLTQQATPPLWYGLRFFNVFGPNEYFKGPMASVAYKAYKQIKETGSLNLFKSYNPDYKDGEQMRDFVYVKDITNWIIELINKKPVSGIYNMGYGAARSWMDMAKAMFTSLDIPIKINWIEMPENIQAHYQYFTKANMEKWKQAKLSDPSFPLELAIADYIQNHLEKDEKVY